MKYFIMFGITVVLSLFIYFYDPYDEYLGVYKDSFYIEYNYNEESYFWIYDKNEFLNIQSVSSSKWEITPNKDGKANITFYYINSDGDIKYSIYYDFIVKGNKIYWTNGYANGLLDYPNPY